MFKNLVIRISVDAGFGAPLGCGVGDICAVAEMILAR